MIIHQQLASFSPSSRQRKADIQGRMKLQSLHISLPIPARRLKYDTNPRPFFLRPVQPFSPPPPWEPFPVHGRGPPANRGGRDQRWHVCTDRDVCRIVGSGLPSLSHVCRPLCIGGRETAALLYNVGGSDWGKGEGRHQFLSTFPCPWHDMQYCGPF